MKTLFLSLRAALRSLVVVLAALGLLALSPAARATAYTNILTGPWNANVSWTNNVVNNPPAGGALDAAIYFNPTATDNSTNNLGGNFLLNQMNVLPNQTVNLYGTNDNALVFTNNAGTLPLLTNSGTGTFTLNAALKLGTNLTVGAVGAITINSNITEATQSQLIKAGSGTLTLNGSNVYSGGTVINGGTLTVNGSIFSPNATLNVGAQLGSAGTNILNTGGTLTVQTLLVTNVNIGAPTNSILAINGGTLTTSNYNGLAANILVASNSTLNIGGSWIMNAGTNIVMNVHTNIYLGAAAAGTVNFFNGLNYGQVLVNTGAVFLAMPANAIGATNTMTMNLSPAGTGNRFVVNGGQVIATNRFSPNGPAGNSLFVFGSGTNNAFIITNGGLVTTLTEAAAAGLLNQNGSRNGLYVGGTNAAGNKSAWIANGGGNTGVGERFNFGNANTNWLAIDSGGVVSNVNFFGYTTTWVFVTNGGAFYHNGLIIGRTGNNSQLLVAGVDGAGNKSLVSGTGIGNNFQLTIGGGTGTPSSPSPGTNNWARVDAGGVVTNMAYVCVGQDTNSWNNSLFITNGGQLYCGSANNSINGGLVQGAYVGYASFCFSNSISVGGGTNVSLLNLGSGGTLGIGNAGAGVSNNTVTLLAGGIVTNLTYLAFGGVNSSFNHQNGGTLALNGANALVSGSGAYILNGVAGSSSGGTLTFANGAVLTGSGTNGGNSVTMNPGSDLVPGGSAAAGTLALGNNLALNSAQLYFTVAATSNSVVNVQNTLTASGVNPVYLSLIGTLPVGNYTLLTFTNTSAVAANFALASGNANASLALNANSLVLQVTGNGLIASNDVWKGTVNGTWDTTTVNWNNGVTATNFNTGDTVVFDDTLSGNSTVTNATPGAVVAPATVTFNNNTIPYTNNANIGGTGSVVKNGTGLVVLTGTNTYSGGTQINAGVLMVTNGGAINAPNSTLVVANTGTNILASGGSITVQSLVVASNETTVLQNQPAFLFNGGTLTTSNGSGTGYAANILLSSNVSWNINGTWNLNGGTNLLLNANTNLVNNNSYVGTAYVGNGVNNALVAVNSNAVLWSAVPVGSQATNVMTLSVGNGSATNNQLVVNGGTILATNLNGQEVPVIVGPSAGSTSNLMTITNGGQVYTAGLRSGGPQAGVIGQNGFYNGLYVAGTNGAGRHSLWDFGKDRLIIGATAFTGSTNSWVRVDQGGVVTNAALFMYCINSCLFITNGGQFYAGANLTVGRDGTNNNLIVWGADPYGNPAYVNGGGSTLVVGGGSAGTMGSNNLVLVGPGGIMTNVTGVNIGGSGPSDTNNFFNGLVVTNGGQLFNTTGGNNIGLSTNCNNNFVTVGGGPNPSLWNMNIHSLTIGSASILGVGANNSSNNYAILYANGMMTNVLGVVFGGVNSALYFNGGTLAAGASGNLITTNIANGTTTTNALNATNFVQAGGAIINDSGFNVTNQVAMLQDPNSTGGGLTKLGSGLLALQGVSTYTGNTTNSAGTLAVNNTGAIGTGLLVMNGGGLLGSATCTVTNAINLNSNSIVGANVSQTLTLTGFITNTASLTLTNNGGVVALIGNATNIGGNVILTPGAQLAPGGVGTVGALNLTNNLTLNGGTLFFDVATGGGDLVAVGNTLTANGVSTIYVSTIGQLAAGDYPLMTFTNLIGTLANFALAGGNANCSLVLNANTLVLHVAGGSLTTDTWKGYQSGTWDTSALNWTNTVGGASVAYASGDAVLFDDTLVANSVIAGATLSPGWVTFNNNLTNYLINAAISGTGSLVKNGTASVTLAGANNYGSNTVINAGTLVLTNGGSIISPFGKLVIGTAPGVPGILTLGSNSAIAVQSLLLTNTPLSGTNSIFNFSGGTLTTSNGNGLAANVMLASNSTLYVSGNLNLLGGTNYIASAQVGGPGANWQNIFFGNSITNTTALVSNAYWSTGNPLTPGNPTNFLPVWIGYNNNASNNVLNITNGGQMFVGNNGAGLGGATSLTIGGNGANNNGLIVAGANGAGQKSWLDAGNSRVYIGTTGTSNNWCVVNGGVITNVGNSGFYSYGNINSSVVITNGGQIYLNPGQNFSVGRCGNTNNYTLLGGFDPAGNPSAIRFMTGFGNAGGGVFIGGQGTLNDSGISGTNDYMIVGQGGLVANASQILVGDDTNAVGNYLIITNGGQVFSTAASYVGMANNYSNCVNNYILLGGTFGPTNSLWNLGGSTLTLGAAAWDTNNYVTLLSGGMLTNVSAIYLQGYYSRFNFNGGTLAAAGNVSLFLTNSTVAGGTNSVGATNYVQAGGAFINDNGYNVTIAMALSGDPNSTGGGLTKLGGGTLNLFGTNTYTGLTTINAGTLLVTNNVALNTGQVVLNGGALFAGGTCTLTNAINLSAASSVGAGSGGILTLTGFITNTASLTVGGLGVTVFSGNAATIGGNVTLSAGAQLAPGGLGTVGALNLTNNLTLNGGGTLLFDVTASGSDLVAVGNTLSASGVTTIFVSVPGPLAQGTSYPLMTFTNNTATLANFVLAGINTNNVTLALTANTLVLQVAAGSGYNGLAGDTWKGYQSGTWDTVALNWTNTVGGASIAYVDNNDSVLFDDTLVGNPIITNALPAGVVSPAAVTFNNNLTSYVLNANIGGNAALNKYGVGVVTLGGTNNFTGGINLYAGTLVVTNDRSLGASNVTENITLNGSGTLQINGANFPLNTNRILNLTGAGGSLYGNGAAFILTNNILQGSGPLFLTGNSYATTTPLVTGSQSNYSGAVIVVSGRPGVGANNITNPYGTGTIIITNGNGGNVGSEMFLQGGTNCLFGNTFILSGTGSEGYGAIRTPASQIFTGTIILTNYPYVSAQIGAPETVNTTNYFYGPIIGPANLAVGKSSGANAWIVFAGTNTYTGNTTIGASGSPCQFMIGGAGRMGSSANYAGYITNYGGFVYGVAGSQTLSGTMSGNGSNIVTAGILTLTGTNYYTGSTFVNGGELLVNGNNAPATGAVQANMGILGGTGTIGGIVNVAGYLAAGGTNNIGTLTLTNNLILNGGVLLADLSNDGSTSDLVVVGGTLTLNSSNLVTLSFPNGPATAGTYTLMTYAARTGSGTLVLNGNYPNTGLTVGPTSVTLTVTNGSISSASIPTPFNWNGNVNGSWDINATANWLTNGTSSVYLDGNAVTFDDTAASYTVSNAIGATFFSPASVTVLNIQNPYNISASIGGAGTKVTKAGGNVLTLSGNNSFGGGLTLNGGTLTINNSNTMGGGLILNAGTLNLNNTNALGSGTLTINGGTVDDTSGIAISNVNNNAQTWNNSFTFGGTANLNLGAGTVTLGTNVTVTGATGNALTLGGNINLGTNYLTHAGNGGFIPMGVISGTGGVTNSAGYMYLTNVQNSYSGPTYLGGGTNYFISIAPVNGGNSSLGNPSSAANGVLNVSGSLRFLGTGTYTSDRLINSIGGITLYNDNNGTLILSGGITNSGVTFRGGGTIVETGPLILGTGGLGRTDNGTVILTNSLNSFTNFVSIQVGTFVVDTLANAGVPCSFGAGAAGQGGFINLGQINTTAQGIIQFVGTNGTTCNRNIYVMNGPLPTDGGCLSNTATGNTITFSGNILVGNSITGSTETNYWTTLGLGGSGNGVISGIIGGGITNINHLAIVKTGTGTWTLSGGNTNNGPIIVNAGALFINGNSGAVTNNPTLTNNLAGYPGFIGGTNSVTVAGGATFGGSGIIGGNVYLNNSAILMPGGGFGTNAGGALTLMTINQTSGTNYTSTNYANSTLTLNGNTLAFNLFNNGACNQVLNGGNLTNNGANLVTLSFPGGPAPAGTYTLMTNANTFGSGTIALAGGYTNVTLNVTATTVQLVVGAGGTYAGALTWKGYVNQLWNINASANWAAGGSAATYADGNAVLFDDSLVGGATVNGAAPGAVVSPAGVSFNNSLTNYTVNANIAGSGSLNLSGQGMVSLAGSNSFSGGVVLNAGTLNLNTNYALGTGAFTINRGTIDNTSGASNSIATGNAMIWNSSFAFAGSSSLNLGAGPATINTNVTIFITNSALTISGNLTNNGYYLAHSVGGTLMINGNLSGTGGFTNNAGFSYQTGLSTYSGLTVFNGGTNYFNSVTTNGGAASALGAPANAAAGVITINGGANPWYTGTGVSTSDRIINWQNGVLWNGGSGTLVLTGGITNNNTTILFRGNGNIVESGVINIGSGNLVRTDAGMLYLTNALNLFTGYVQVSNGTNSIDTIANSGSACSLGAGSAVYLGQLGFNVSAGLQFLGTNGSACNRTIYLNGGAGSSAGGLIEIASPGTTLTFSGNIVALATNNAAASITALTLCGAGNGVLSGSLAGTNALNLLTITKTGTGTWTLSGINTNTGTVTVKAGTLLINGNSSAATNTVTVNAGATFGGTGTNGGSVVMNAGAELAPGGAGNAGVLLLTNNLTLNNTYLLFNLTNSRVAVGNNLSASGSNAVILSYVGTIPQGNYTLMTFTNLTAGAIGNFSLAGNPANATLALNANSLVLQVGVGGLTSSGGDVWKGFVNGTWDATTGNWTNGVPSNLYTSGDAVTFDDTLAGNSTVGSGATVVTPASVTFNNYIANYTINANMGGSGSLTMSAPGMVTLAGTNSYAGNTTINAGTLLVTNTGIINSPNATLNIGATAGLFATNTLAAGGNITVQTLLVTNISYTATNSIFNFNGGTLTTSNNNGVAANLLVQSNTSWNLNGVWNANAGTNIIVGMNTNGGPGNGAAFVYVGNGVNGAQLNVNSNAVWWHQLAVPGTMLATNEIGLIVGNGNATNSLVMVNGGAVIITNGSIQNSSAGTISVTIGNSANSVTNQVVVTNGGQLIMRGRGDNGFGAIIIGAAFTNYSSLIVGGTNGAGVKSLVDCKNDRFYVGNNGTSGAYSLAQVGAGGMITNANVYVIANNCALYVTNGGQLYVNSLSVGRYSSNSVMVVGGTDAGGNKSLVGLAPFSGSTSFTLTVGGASGSSSQPEAFNTVRIDAGGVITNAGGVGIGGSSGALSDSNVVGNVLIITNGGQLFSVGSGWVGYQNGCSSNQLSLGGGSGMSLWRMNNASLTLGNDLYASNNVMTLFSGGVLTNVSSLILGGSYSVLNFNGGTLAAGGNGNLIATNSGTYLSPPTNALYTNLCYFATNYIQAGGAIIDSVTFTVTNVVPFAQDPGSIGGGLTKLGVGTLVLATNNTYTGPTVVTAGNLLINNAITLPAGGLLTLNGGTLSNSLGCTLNNPVNLNAASTVGVASGQVLTLTGAITNNGSLTLAGTGIAAFGGSALTVGGNVIMNAGAGLAPAGIGGIGTLVLTNSLTLNGNNLYFDVTSAANDLVAISNSLTLNGVNLVNLGLTAGRLAAGSYTLMTFANGFTGSGSFVLNGAFTNALNVTLNIVGGNALVLQVGSGGLGVDTWKGYQSGVWDASTPNWTNGAIALAYADGDTVIFDDTLVGNSVVSGGPLAPASVLFNNSLTNYLISASIGGAGGLTKSGSATVTLAGANIYASNTVINAGTLVVSNGGSIFSPNAVLNIGPVIGSGGTNTLLAGGAITVRSLLATNITFVATNSVFNFNGGTLITSNGTGVGYAANILMASNANWMVSGNWNMNGGTNIFANIATNGGAGSSVQIGYNVNNAQVMVNKGAVWWSYNSNTLLNAYATNVVQIYVGNGNATNNQLVVNGGTVIATNYYGQNPPIIVGNSGNPINNQLIVTNGGQVYVADLRSSGPTALLLGQGGTNNGIYVGGTNSAGAKSFIDTASDRLALANFNNWVRVDQGGMITNVSLLMGGYGNNAVYITNGGVIFANWVTLGRNATNDTLNIAGADGAGNLATLGYISGTPLVVGGAYPNTAVPGNPGINCAAIVGQGGQVTNWNAIYVGGGVATDSNSVNNALVITNGGQVVNPAAVVNNSLIGFLIGCNSNSISLGGGGGTSLWNLKNTSLTIGYAALSTNNYLTLFSGGVMTNATSVILGGVNSALNFNGGMLAAGAGGNLITTNTATINATNYVQAGGAVINDSGYSVTNRLAMLQDPNSTGGGLTKLGGGTLALLGVNTYTGPTVVSAGTLALSGSASIANSSSIVLAGGAVLNVAGLGSTFALASGQVLSNSTSTATINCGLNGFNTASGTVALTYASGTPSLAVTNGTLTLSVGTTFTVTSAGLLPGTYRIISKLTGGTVAVSGSLPAVTVVGGPNQGIPTLSLSNGELYLTVGGVSTWTYSGTSFTYNGAAQSPSITSFSGSTATMATNYVGVSPTSYGPSVNAPTNVGSYYVTNTVPPDANYFGATFSQGFTIGQTNLTVTAQSNTKAYDGTTSAATLPLVGPGSIQPGDGTILVETYATAAAGTGKTLNPAVVSITNAAGANVTANYSVNLVPDTTGVITVAPVTFNLFSSAVTNGYHASVFFTATNLPVDASSNVVFQANGVAFSTNSVAGGGTTSLTITNLPRGNTNVIIATYNGDNNYAAYVTNLIQTVTNHPPVATNLVVYRPAGEPLRVFWTNIATYWSDVDGDTVTNIGINLVTTNGITLLTNSSEIIYTNSPDVNDQFSYTIADGYGGTNTGIVDIIIDFSNPFVGQENNTIISTNGGKQITFYGVLGLTYVVERNVTDITDTNYWMNFITNSVITNQVMIITDTNNPYAYYRLRYQRAP